MKKKKRKGTTCVLLAILLVFLAPCIVRIFHKDMPKTNGMGVEKIEFDKEQIYF